MQAASNDDFKETKTILKELESLFSREDITYDVEDINKLRAEIDSQTVSIISEYHTHVKGICLLNITDNVRYVVATITYHMSYFISFCYRLHC